MDFETFGEHQWVETGIFDFFSTLIGQSVKQNRIKFLTPSQQIAGLSPSAKKALPIYDVAEPISWADVDRDLTAWRDNPLQQDTLHQLYSLEKKMRVSKDKKLVEDWRRLQTSDHFYYMCTKWAADGDVHAYFSPYKDPYEAYTRFATVLSDLKGKISSV
jgi:alpha-amylase